MQPLFFEPYYRPQVWGARRLESELGRPLPPSGGFGEAWELSGHPHHVSRVAEGPLAGTPLTDLWKDRRTELCGQTRCDDPRFPLLFKYLDCHEQLSVQVHPTDEIARELIGDESGKTEAWVVLAAEPTGRIYAGLRPGTTCEVLERHLDAGTVDECLHSFAPQPGDCVSIPAGTVHAVGGGVLMAEVQQTSDATFRLFDWNRLGTDGKPRALHRHESLRSIDWSAGPVAPVSGEPLSDLPAGVSGELLVRTPYFELNRIRLSQPLANPFAQQLSIWMVLTGQVELVAADGYRRQCRVGDTLLIPGTTEQAEWRLAAGAGSAVLLAVRLP